MLVEVNKAWMAYFISVDWRLFDASRGLTTSVKNLSVLEDLGMISYVFADKTGTLTRNQMEFYSMCVGHIEFGQVDAFPYPVPNIAGEPHQAQSRQEFDMDKVFEYLQGRAVPDNEVRLLLRSENQRIVLPILSMQELMQEFLTAISLNHECISVEKKPSTETQTVKAKKYQGTSPDEVTLVEFAKKCGFEFLSSSDHFAKIKITTR